jgi:2-polyprenyl-6-methoxyphenol hydroxylase-like FAD-dependent oxidoreductase
MAGLLAARVLSERYDEVTIADRDEMTAPGAPRRGVPQGRHAHVLLARGQQVLEALFPGLTDALTSAGAPRGDVLAEATLHFGGHRLCRTQAGLSMVSVSRPFLERQVRARVAALPNTSFAPPCDIVGLTSTRDGGRVTGARVLRRADGSAAEVIEADLVVDATGRGSRAPSWLKDLRCTGLREERVGQDVRYTTTTFPLPADVLGGDWGTIQAPTPDLPRGGALSRLEDGRWLLTLIGLQGDSPPTDPQGFAEFAGSLRYPEIHDAIRGAAPLERPAAYRFPMNVRRRYERLTRLPAGFVVMGDGLCSFNPIYGQGMTVAALQALALRAHLQRFPVPRPRRLFRQLARVVDAPWEIAIGNDLAFPGAQGPRSRKLQVLGAYMTRLQAAAARNPDVARAFVRASNMIDAPEALMHPAVLLRVLRDGRLSSHPPAQ